MRESPKLNKVKKVVVIKASETRTGSHSEFALACLVASLKRHADLEGISLDLREYHLADYFTEISTPKDPAVVPPELESLVDDFFHNDLLLIGVPLHNFAPSVLLQIFFHRTRPRLLTFDERDQLVSRNWNDHNVGIVLTGRSSKLKYLLLNQFVFYVHFDMLFDFWGERFTDNPLRVLLRPQHRIAKTYIGDCRRSTFEARKPEIAQQMTVFARKVSRHLS